MKVTYAGKIAWTKFKARRVRTIISAVITAIMLVILISLSLGYTGNRNALKATPGLDSDRALAQVYSGGFGSVVDADGNFIDPLQSLTLDKAQALFSDYDIVQTYNDRELFGLYPIQNITVDSKPIPSDNSPSNQFNQYNDGNGVIIMREDELLAENVQSDQQIAIGQDGSIPVLLNTDVLLLLEGKNFSTESAEQRVDIISSLTDEYIGRTISLGLSSSDSSLKLRIIGYAPKDSLFYTFRSTAYVPSSVIGETQKQQIEKFRSDLLLSEQGEQFAPEDQNQPIVSTFDQGFGTQAIIEFANTAELQRFITDKSCGNNFEDDCLVIQIMQNTLLELDEEISVIWGFLKYVVGFFFVITAIFLFFTTSKVIGDSRKETGVFRAMGAKRLDIAIIYFFYTAIITTLAYFIALVISLILMLIVTLRQGPDLSVVITNLTGNYADPVSVSFIGFNIVHLLGILLLAIIVGLVGGLLPIVRNVTIDPIKAMRTE